MAIVRHLKRQQPQIEAAHTEVNATYAIVLGDDGRPWLQIDTYGSVDREIPGKKSQSIRLTTEAITQLRELLHKHFADTAAVTSNVGWQTASLAVDSGSSGEETAPRELKEESVSPSGSRGIPRKRRGEHFSGWWQRLADREAHRVTVASRFIGVTPQSIFNDYTRYEDDPE